MKIVIIEDELLTAKDLADCIAKAEPAAQIIATLSSVKEAVAFFKENDEPDLIFSDIQLGDGVSFEIFDTLKKTTPVIFCTAYDEYALNAFKAAGIDYILKPFTVKTITAALEKYNTFKNKFSGGAITDYSSMATVMDNIKKQKQQCLLVYYKEKILPVMVGDIAVLYLQKDTTHIVTFSKQQYFIDKTLEEIENTVVGDFYRANRQYLVNRKAIKDISQYFGRKLMINLTIPFDDKITVSKAKANHFLAWLAGG
jgi:DNA-binding LytR/AlgR family response regulator